MNIIRKGENLAVRAFMKTMLDADDVFDGAILTDEEYMEYFDTYECEDPIGNITWRGAVLIYFVLVPMTCLMGLLLKIAKLRKHS